MTYLYANSPNKVSGYRNVLGLEKKIVCFL